MIQERIIFKNRKNYELTGIVQLPDKKPTAFALFAHGFTCSKNMEALGYISDSLVKSGMGVLRFDFTGLGESEGDFSDTNFSSNIEDLVDAGKYLEKHFELLNFLYHLSGNPFNILSKTTNMVYIRAGLVILIIYIILELSTKLNRLPKIIEVTGRYSLLIYVVHLFILYGSALNRGMAYYYSYSFNILESVISAVGLIILMILLAYAAHFVESGKWLLRKR